MPVLPRGLRVGAELFGIFLVEGARVPRSLGRITRVAASGYYVGRRLYGLTETPLFASMAAVAWCEANPLRMPTAPSSHGQAGR